VSSLAGTIFIKSIDGSKLVKVEKKIFEMLDTLGGDWRRKCCSSYHK